MLIKSAYCYVLIVYKFNCEKKNNNKVKVVLKSYSFDSFCVKYVYIYKKKKKNQEWHHNDITKPISM